MIESFLEIVTPAASQSLISLAEAKIAMSISDSSFDQFLTDMIKRQSGVIATTCDRSFGKEEVTETFAALPSVDPYRIWLARWPVIADDITEVTANGVDMTVDDYYLDSLVGKIVTKTLWTPPVVITYSGGYELPDESPESLRQAVVLLMQDKFTSGASGSTILKDASIRMIAHKESRVMYYQGESGSTSASSSGGAASGASASVRDLCRRFIRRNV